MIIWITNFGYMLQRFMEMIRHFYMYRSTVSGEKFKSIICSNLEGTIARFKDKENYKNIKVAYKDTSAVLS